MRQELGIPPDAFVIGRHGACETFNLKFVHEAVIKALSKRKDLYFVFVNTHRFCEHERVIHLPVITDTLAKSNFINACDAMLHARSRGESFGLAVAEFMFFDKPVICWAGGVDRNHLEMLPDHRLVYRRNPDLLRILTSLEKCGGDGRWQDSVSAFTPPNVMRLFKEVFIDGAPQDHSVRPSLAFTIRTRIAQRWLKARYDLWREGIRI